MGRYTIVREELRLADAQSFDGPAARAAAATFDLAQLTDYPLAELVLSAAHLLGEETLAAAEALFNSRRDRPALLAVVTPAQARQLLTADLDRLEQLLAGAEDELPYDNYQTFGYGYQLLRLGQGLVLRAELCCEMAGAGNETVEERGQTPYETLKRLRLAGIVAGSEEIV